MKRFISTDFSKPAAITFWLLVWQLCALKIGEGLLLPSPFAVLSALGRLVLKASFWQAAAHSVFSIAAGLAAAFICASALAMLSDCFAPVRALLSPLVVITRTTPVASFIILLLLWVRSAQIASPIAALMAAPVIYTALLTGLSTIDRGLLEAAKTLGLSPLAVMFKLKLPLAFPFLSNGVQTAIGLAFKAAVAAEVISQTPASLGGQLFLAKTYLETAELFAVTVVILLLSKLLETISELLGDKLLGKGRHYC